MLETGCPAKNYKQAAIEVSSGVNAQVQHTMPERAAHDLADDFGVMAHLLPNGSDALVGRHKLERLASGGPEGRKGAVHAGIEADHKCCHPEKPLQRPAMKQCCLAKPEMHQVRPEWDLPGLRQVKCVSRKCVSRILSTSVIFDSLHAGVSALLWISEIVQKGHVHLVQQLHIL